MPIVQNIGGRFQWTQPCFAFIDVHTAAKIITVLDFMWSVFGFLSTFIYALYWYDLSDLHDALEKADFNPLKLVRYGSEFYFYQPMHVTGLLTLSLGFSVSACWNCVLFLRLRISNWPSVPLKVWISIFVLNMAIRPFAFLLVISLTNTDFTEIAFAVATVFSILFTIYGIWIITAFYKKKTLPPRPLITYEGEGLN